MAPHYGQLTAQDDASRLFPVRTRRDRILVAIAAVVADEGFDACSVSKIVATAGVSRTTFYEHFANKEECFLAAYDATVEQVMLHVRASRPPTADRRACLEAGFDAFLRFAAAEPALAWLCVVEVLAAGPRALARRDAAMAAFGAYLEQSCAGETAARVPRLMTEVLVGGVYELIYARVLHGETAGLAELLPDIMYVWLVPFLGAAPTAAAAGTTRPGPARPHLWIAPPPIWADEDEDVF